MVAPKLDVDKYLGSSLDDLVKQQKRSPFKPRGRGRFLPRGRGSSSSSQRGVRRSPPQNSRGMKKYMQGGSSRRGVRRPNSRGSHYVRRGGMPSSYGRAKVTMVPREMMYVPKGAGLRQGKITSIQRQGKRFRVVPTGPMMVRPVMKRSNLSIKRANNINQYKMDGRKLAVQRAIAKTNNELKANRNSSRYHVVMRNKGDLLCDEGGRDFFSQKNRRLIGEGDEAMMKKIKIMASLDQIPPALSVQKSSHAAAAIKENRQVKMSLSDRFAHQTG